MFYGILNFKDPEVKREYIKHIKSLFSEEEVFHRRVVEKRTVKSHRYYGALLNKIKEHTGASTKQLHKEFKKLWIEEVRLDPNAKLSTIDMSQSEFADYIGFVERWFFDYSGRDIDEEIYP